MDHTSSGVVAPVGSAPRAPGGGSNGGVVVSIVASRTGLFSLLISTVGPVLSWS